MTNFFVAHNPNVLSHACRVMCLYYASCAMTVPVKMWRAAGVSVWPIARESNFRASEMASLNKKKNCSVHDEVRQEFQLSFDF